jgi:hypothetical protein
MLFRIVIRNNSIPTKEKPSREPVVRLHFVCAGCNCPAQINIRDILEQENRTNDIESLKRESMFLYFIAGLGRKKVSFLKFRILG